MQEEAQSSKGSAALKAWREANKDKPIVVLNPIEKAKANPKSLKYAIQAKCWDCSNFQREEVKLCTVKSCALWNLRPWQGKSKVSSVEEQDED
jgi:hypothetical protein